MPLEAYVPSEISLAGQPLDEISVLTLYDPDSDEPHGALTGPGAPEDGHRAGPLTLVGVREGAQWRVELDEIEVCHRTPVGCEFTIFGSVRRTRLTPTE
ncbi:MAG: hypothetical protein JXO22_03860 [Phycisphaerae bacterium]|nr:hypothetical protein [Phycisphaerae bacterium]